MKRVLILGPGASGKSTLARQLGEVTGLRVTELDKIFWQPGPVATPRDKWVEIQQKLLEDSEWIMDGDLGPYDAIEVRLRAADTIIFLDFGVIRCAWRAIWRSRERLDFWRWLLRYRGRSRPLLMKAILTHASTAAIHVLRHPPAVRRFVLDVARLYRGRNPSSSTDDSEHPTGFTPHL
jgi:adenylate kinase family enzyme